ncbi:MAG: MBL fold metallo-hydrolase, partial [Patescibacteria group bacterium]
EADGISIAHLGDFGERTLREETLEALGDVDVLLIPVGGTDTIGAEDAAGIVRQLEPRVVIPMHYRLPGLTVTLDPADRFLATYGGREPQRLAKLTLKPKDLPDTDTRIVLLSTE